jgi:predicted ABC-type transport system involved in lysophospholipase L1 biosynthesis ATPase subunit
VRSTVAIVAETLSLEAVQKGYSRGEQWTSVLTGVSLQVEPGEVVAIIGGRLRGKTTLLKTAAGLECPDQGTVSLGGRDLAALGERSRSRLLGSEIMWIDRGGPESDMEVSKFVGWPLVLHGRGRGHAERMAAQALERVGARACVGQRWRELSNRQRVLVGLARAFAGSPRIVIVDDLLDALGRPESRAASDLLRSLVEESEPGCGMLISVSDVESATEILPDRAFSLTSKGTLKPFSGRSTDDTGGGGMDGGDMGPGGTNPTNGGGANTDNAGGDGRDANVIPLRRRATARGRGA